MKNQITELKDIKFTIKFAGIIVGAAVSLAALCIDYRIDKLRAIKK